MLDWLPTLAPVAWLNASWVAYAVVNAAHILGIALLVGAIMPLDLRLLGLIKSPPLAGLAPFLSRAAAGGAVLAVVTGLWLFATRPGDYLANPAFLAKLAILVVALVNVALVHTRPAWRALVQGAEVPAGLRLTAGVSAAAWVSALVAGRMIGFL